MFSDFLAITPNAKTNFNSKTDTVSLYIILAIKVAKESYILKISFGIKWFISPVSSVLVWQLGLLSVQQILLCVLFWLTLNK